MNMYDQIDADITASILEQEVYRELTSMFKDKRIAKGFSISDLALEAGVKPSTIKLFEEGKTQLKRETVRKIGRVLNA